MFIVNEISEGIVMWLLASNQIQSSALIPGSGGLQQVWCSSDQIQSSMENVAGRSSNLRNIQNMSGVHQIL
ncbi:hypothetical protein Hanom_Chr12g01084541 [Helianthus anomalus]